MTHGITGSTTPFDGVSLGSNPGGSCNVRIFIVNQRSSMYMHISNIRLGLATNSSSTHSIVFGVPMTPDLINLDNGPDNNHSYDRGPFILTKVESKLDYVAVTIYQSLCRTMPTKYAQAVIKDLFGFVVDPEASIDHQSAITLPINRKGVYDKTSFNEDFIRDFIIYISRPDIVILGGGDKYEVGHNEQSIIDRSSGGSKPISEHFEILTDRDPDVIAKRDGEYWILFNQTTGAKMRLSFAKDPKPYVKSKTPELVDLKITNYCPFGCAYCYQSSTTQGKHSESIDLNSIIAALSELEVFEVAIGGGEPTLYPKFKALIYSCQYYSIIPNFTTRNLGWLIDQELVKAVKEAGSGIAFSIDTSNKMKDIYGKFQAAGLVDKPGPAYYSSERKKLIFQYVMGSGNIWDLQHILENAYELGCSVTLLGYKRVGFGDDYEPQDYSNWLSVIEKLKEEEGKCPAIGIDTALANEYKDDLEIMSDIAKFIQYEEGAFSMYIDAVTSRLAPSSYCEESKYVALNQEGKSTIELSRAISTAFAGL